MDVCEVEKQPSKILIPEFMKYVILHGKGCLQMWRRLF